MAQVKPYTTITNTITTTTTIDANPETEANQTELPLDELLASLSEGILKKGKKRTRSPSSNSTSSSSTSSAGSSSITTTSTPPQQQKKKRPAKWLPLAIETPPKPTFHGSITINPRAEALQYAKSAYETQFDAAPNTSWHVFYADGSTYHLVPGSTGTGVVYSTQRVDNFVDRGFALQDLSDITHLEMFGIGASLRIALERIIGLGREGEEVVCESEFEKEWSSSSSSSSASGSEEDMGTKRKQRKQKRRRERRRTRKEDEEEKEKEEEEEKIEKPAPTPSPSHKHKVSVFSDSQEAIKALRNLSNQTGPESETEARKPGRALTLTVAGISKRLADLGVEAELRWIPGHTDHVAHKRVDLIAKAAARHAASFLKGKVERTSRDKVVQVVDSGYLELELP